MNEHFINQFLLADRQSAIALSDTTLHAAFLACGSLNAREYIVNLNRVAVSSVCYYTSVPNKCSSFALGSVTSIIDLIWLAKLMYEVISDVIILICFWGCCFREKCVMLLEEKEGSMPTQDERLSTVEQSVVVLRKGIADIHHNETVLLGVMAEQGKDIREMKVSLAVLNERVGAFDQGVNDHFEVLESHLGPFEQNVNNRFEVLEGHLGSFEQSVNTRFGEQDKKLDDLGRLLLQVLDRLPPS